jgi:hypothetical protein
LYDSLGEIYDKLKIKEIEDEVFKQITLVRIIEPASKLDTMEILPDFPALVTTQVTTFLQVFAF